jgi:acetyl-CoA carboxylase beta subunit/acetyl-CoA carboxylase alpha subunit
MSKKSTAQAAHRLQVHRTLRHPDRLQADVVAENLLEGVRYATDIARDVLGLEGGNELHRKMRRMGVIGGEGRFRLDDNNVIDVIFAGDLKPRGDDLESRVAVNHGVVSPAGMVFKNRLYREAEKKGKLLLLFPNTLGGEAGTRAALAGQSWLVSANIYTLLSLQAPIISIVLGEGGSGGALAGQIADQCLMMEHAGYAVISPEQGAWILRGSRQRKDDAISDDELTAALDVLRPTARDLAGTGIVDAVVPEFPGGSHLEKDAGYAQTLGHLETAVRAALEELGKSLKKPATLQRKRVARALGYGTVQRYSALRRVVRSITALAPISPKIPRERVSLPPKDALFELAHEQHRDKLDKWGINGDEGIKCQGRTFHPPLNDKLDYREQPCGAILTEKEFRDNYKSCPHCGWGERLQHADWLHALTDAGAFREFDADLKYEDFEPTIYTGPGYLAELARARDKTGLQSAATTGIARIGDLRVVFYLLDFAFMGGTLGIAEGEKFCRAADRARREKVPLVGVFPSGGVRMSEGTLGLKQMEKTLAGVHRLDAARVPFCSVLVSPCTGGVISSNASAANHIISERYGIFSFAGPGVVRSAGGEIEDYAMAPPIICRVEVPVGKRRKRRTIDKILFRKDMKSALYDYVAEYYWLTRKP